MTDTWVRTAKRVLPGPVYSRARTWALRVLTWHRLMRQVRGAGPVDAVWLWASFLAAPVTSLSRLSEWRDPILLHHILADVKDIGRFRLRASTDDLWHVVPLREPAVLACIRTLLRPGDIFVDAGANIGTYTVTGARRVGPAGRVLAVEMLKGTADVLRGHIALNDLRNVEVVEAALSERAGERIRASMPEGSFGQASIARASGSRSFEVVSTTFDAILKDIPSVRLIKIDIEGAELAALKGGVGSLDRVDAIIFEHLNQQALDEIATLLAEHGFQAERLDGSNSLARRPGRSSS